MLAFSFFFMEFGVMSSNGVVVSSNGLSSFSSDHALKRKWCGSTDFLQKQQMSEFSHDNNEDFKPTNLGKLSDDSPFVFSDNQQEQNMLSFSSLPKLDAFSLKNNGELESKNLLQNSTSFPYFQHSNSSYSKNAGYSSNGNLNASMYFMNGFKGPFTASQWFELEQQALIFKFILANQPIPPSLLISIRRAFESARFSSFPAGLMRPNMFGWGPFHLGFAHSTDPEAGRCRRTDGKKWRCSRDAVPDQKYCERHINRGRHRSRKPVEGLTGHSVSGANTNRSSNTNTTTGGMNNGSSSSALVVPRGAPSNSAASNLDQSKDIQLQPVPSNHLPSSLAQRLMENKANSSQKMQSTKGFDILSPKNCLNSTDSTAGDFPFLTSDAILSATHRGSSVLTTHAQSHDLNVELSSQGIMKDPSSNSWPKLQTQTNRTTKLSISIQPADFMSSTSSPTGEKVALSPLRLSRELDHTPVGMGMDMGMCMGMDFGLDTVSNDQSPISWESSMGGPLGEVLKTTTSNSSGGQSTSISALNLITKGSEGSPQMASSPTGVLQRTAMMSYYSNSSSGSSPQAEIEKAYRSGTVNGDLIGFTLGKSSSLPL